MRNILAILLIFTCISLTLGQTGLPTGPGTGTGTGTDTKLPTGTTTTSTTGTTGGDVGTVTPAGTTAPPRCPSLTTVGLCAEVGFPVLAGRCSNVSDILRLGCVCRVAIDLTLLSEGVRKCDDTRGGFLDDTSFPIFLVPVITTSTLPTDPITGDKLFPPPSTTNTPILIDTNGNFTVASGTCSACTASARSGAITTFAADCDLRNCDTLSTAVSTIDSGSAIIVAPTSTVQLSNTAVDGSFLARGVITGPSDMSVSVSVASTGNFTATTDAGIVDLRVDFAAGSIASFNGAAVSGSTITFRAGAEGSFTGSLTGAGTTIVLDSTSTIAVGDSLTTTFPHDISSTSGSPSVKSTASVEFTGTYTGVTFESTGPFTGTFSGVATDVVVTGYPVVTVRGGAAFSGVVDSTNEVLEVVGSASTTDFSGSLTPTTRVRIASDAGATAATVGDITPMSLEIFGGATSADRLTVGLGSVVTPGPLTASGDAVLTASGTIDVTGFSISGSLDVTGTIISRDASSVDVDGHFSVDTSTVTGSVDVRGTLTVRDTLSASTVDVSGKLELGSDAPATPIPTVDETNITVSSNNSVFHGPKFTGPCRVEVKPTASIRINGDVDGDSAIILINAGGRIEISSTSAGKRQTTSSVSFAPSIEGSGTVDVTGTDVVFTGKVDTTHISAPSTSVSLAGDTTDVTVDAATVTLTGDSTHVGSFTAGTITVAPGSDSTVTATFGVDSSVSTVTVVGDKTGPSSAVFTHDSTVETFTIDGDITHKIDFSTGSVTATAVSVSGVASIKPLDASDATEHHFREFTVDSTSDLTVDAGVVITVAPLDGDSASVFNADAKVSGDGELKFTGDVSALDSASIGVKTTVSGGTLTVGSSVTFGELVIDHATVEGKSSAGDDLAPRVTFDTFRSETEGNTFVAVFNSDDTSTDASIGVAAKCIIKAEATIIVRGTATLDADSKVVLTCTDISEVDADMVAASTVTIESSKRATCDGKAKVDGNNVVVYCETQSTDDSGASSIIMMVIAFVAILF